MREAWAVWRKAATLAWTNLTRLIVVNLLWAFASLPLVTAGPATLALYQWLARTIRDGQEQGYIAFFQAMGRLATRGLLWSAGWALILWLANLNVAVYSQLLPPLGAAVAQVIWIYGLVFLGAMQPYLLEALTIAHQGWGQAIRGAAWQVLANPVYSHAHLALVVAAVALGSRFATLLPVVLVAVGFVFWSVASAEVSRKYGEPLRVQGRIEDVH